MDEYLQPFSYSAVADRRQAAPLCWRAPLGRRMWRHPMSPMSTCDSKRYSLAGR